MSAAKYTPESLESLLSSLSRREAEPDHSEILKHANNVIKTSKGDPRALHTKAVALLHLDRHEDALKLFEGPEGSKLAGIADLEHAYCLYKVGKLQEAVELAKSASAPGTSSRALKHISAQAYYRLENFEEAANICKALADGQYEAPNEDGDLRVNTAATDAQLVWSGKRDIVGDKKTPREDLDIFEGTFNAACFSIAKGEYGPAAVLLNRAKQLCEDLEDLTEEEKEAELEPVIAQEIYLFARTGQVEKAALLAESFDSENVFDDALKVISAINAQSVFRQREDYNPYLGWKKYQTAVKQATTLASRPFGFQARLLHINEAILDLDIGKTNAAANKATEHHNLYPTDRNSNIVNAAAQTADKSGKGIEKKIQQMFETNHKDIGLALTLVQLRMDSGNVTGAIETMNKLFEHLESEFKYQPSLVGLFAALYAHQGRKKDVRKLLSAASKWWLAQPNPNSSVLREAGKAQLASEDTADLSSAGEIFAALLKTDPKDRISTAGLVASYATTDISKVSSYVDSLTPVATLISDIDVSALESAGVAQVSRKRGAEDIAPPEQPKKIRKKKARLPKDYDPAKKVDAERWLPMRDRSYYKPKGKKDKKKVAAATQGGAVAESMELAGGGRVDVQKVSQTKNANKKKKKGKK